PFNVVLLLGTMLGFPEKWPLLRATSGAPAPDGRGACTLEGGEPLTEAERGRMPDADTVWLVPIDEMLDCMQRVGLAVRWQSDCTWSHLATATSPPEAFAADAVDIAA